MVELLVVWSKASCPTSTGIKPAVFYPLDLHWPPTRRSASGHVRDGSTRLKCPQAGYAVEK
jgi:hypothetical protein